MKTYNYCCRQLHLGLCSIMHESIAVYSHSRNVFIMHENTAVYSHSRTVFIMHESTAVYYTPGLFS